MPAAHSSTEERWHSADMQQRAHQASAALADFTQSQFLYLQNLVNVIGPLVALSVMSLWTGNVAILGNISTVLSLRLQNVSRRLVGERLADVFGPARQLIAHNVEFTYVRADGARAGIRDVDVTLRRGDRIAVIGPSGGKSTLLRVIAGLYDPQRVQYEVDGEAAERVRHLGSVSTLIPQESEIFEATLRENVTFGAPYPDEQIERVGLSALDAVAASLPQKWNMPLSERGINLSGGQRQRLALARGLLAGQRSSVLLLDEPTSALDQATEATVFERLREGLPDACLIASIHRQSALVYFNRVIVMAEGRIVDSGTVAEIMERQTAFREVVYSAAHDIRARAAARVTHGSLGRF